MILLQHADQLSYEEVMALDTAALVVQIMAVTGLDMLKLANCLGTVEHQWPGISLHN